MHSDYEAFLKSKLSLNIANKLVPLDQLLDFLQPYCLPMAFRQDHEVFELSGSGSSFLFRHKNHNLLVCTRHQTDLEHRHPSRISILLKQGSEAYGVPLDSYSVPKVDTFDQTVTDVLISEFASTKDGFHIQDRFLDLDISRCASLTEISSEKVKLIFGIGYPTRLSDFGTNDDEDGIPNSQKITSRWVKLYLLNNGIPDHFETRLSLQADPRYHPADIGDPDGFSGSPVFFVWQDDSFNIHLGFAGLITHGSASGQFLVYPAETIRQVVSQVILTK